MPEKKLDRRVQRTRELLRSSLMQLIHEKGYDTVTIQDITDKANLGRTTFYLHYETKDELLLDHHADFTTTLNLGTLSSDELLGDVPQYELIEFLQEMYDGKFIYFAIKRAKDSDLILEGIQQQMVELLQESVETTFPGRTPNMPPDALMNYIIRAQLSLIDWWLSRPTEHDARTIASMLHKLQRAAICQAYDVE